ncbi:hypothetical protein YC2023_119359 [Brassica napus]
MGISFSNRRRNNHHRRYHHHLPPPPPYYYSDQPQQPPPPQPPHNEYSYTHNHLVSAPQHSLPPPSQPQPQPQPQPHPPPQINYGSYGYNYNQIQNPQQQQPPYFSGYHPNGWNTMMRPVFYGPAVVVDQQPPQPYVEHQSAKKVRNDVNVHKDTVRLEADDLNPGYHLVSFLFDAVFDGSFTIIFFAKEEENCTMVPQFPEAFKPTQVPFQKGTAQKFVQPSGTGTDLGFFSLDDLSNPLPDEVYPLVISAETVISPSSGSEEPLVHKQITLACLEKTDDGSFKVKVMKQILWIEGARYELRELYGIDNSTAQDDDVASGLEDSGDKECVICLTEPKDTAVMPCRHLCLCSDCAKELRFQSNKCPICRQPFDELLMIKVETQKFVQPSGTVTDLGFFSLDDLSNPLPDEVDPLVISAETVISPSSGSEEPLVHKQITLACLEKTDDGSFKVKVMKQILWIEGARYELRELYGIDNSTAQDDDVASGLEDSGDKECVICLTEPKDTAVMPCRHLCLCSDCAKELRFQSKKCPICRQPFDELLMIKVESSNEQH